MQEDVHAETGSGLSRRDVLARLGTGGAAAVGFWAAPSILSLSSSAVAAATCGPAILVPFPTSWTPAQSGFQSGGGPVGYQAAPPAPWNAVAPAHVVENSGEGAVATYQRSVTLVATTEYTFTFNYRWRHNGSNGFLGLGGPDTRVQILTAEIQLAPSGPWTSQTIVTTSTGTGSTTFTSPVLQGTFVFTPPTSGNYNFRYRHTFGTTGGTYANDLAVGAPTITNKVC